MQPVALWPSPSLHYMVSEVGWLAFVCSHPLRSSSRTPTHGHDGNGDSSSFAWQPVLIKRTTRSKSVPYFTVWAKTPKTIPQSTNITGEKRKKYASVIGKFDAFFRVRKNVIFERARFNRRSQGPDESAEQFITSLYSLTENCVYGELRDEIRDRIVVGIRNRSLSDRLQIESDLTLEKAKTLVRQREAVQEQQALLRNGPKQELAVDFVKRGPPFKKKVPYQTAPKGSQSSDSSKQCSRCGKGPHPRQSCPARDAVCHNCKKKGHYSSQCFSAKSGTGVTKTNTVYDTLYDTSYLTAVAAGQSTTSWTTTVALNGHETAFKLDTGAEVTVISDSTLNSFGVQDRELQSSYKRLCGPDNRPLEVVGELSGTLEYKGRSCVHPVYVVRELQQNLLGLPAIQSLHLLAQVDAVGMSIPNEYPGVFTGLGTFPKSYQIQLKPDAQPFASFTPRNVPIPLRNKVQEELSRMESLGVISRAVLVWWLYPKSLGQSAFALISDA